MSEIEDKALRLVNGIDDANKVNLQTVNLTDLDDAEIPPPRHIIEQLLPVGVASSLSGHGGAGKSALALLAAVKVALGQDFFGQAAEQVPVLFYSAEDDATVLRYRTQGLLRALDVKAALIADKLHIIDATTIDPALFIERNEQDVNGSQKKGVTTTAFDALKDYAQGIGARLIIIDNASDTFEANENERARVRGFVRSLSLLARHIDGAVLFLSHIDKATAKGQNGGGEAYSGSTAWHNSVRSRMYLHGDDGNLTLEHQKANFGPKADPIELHWEDGQLCAGHIDPGKDPAQVMLDNANLAAILMLIRRLADRGAFVSTSSTAGNAWTTLQRLDGYPPINKRDFWKLMERAESLGYLIREGYERKHRKPAERYTVTETGLEWAQSKTKQESIDE